MGPTGKRASRLLALLAASGCGTLQIYPGSRRPPEEVARIEAAASDLGIASLDHVEVLSVDGEEIGSYRDSVEVLPGLHVVKTCRGAGTGVKSQVELSFEAKPGHRYEVDGKDLSFSPLVVAFWIVDAKDGSVVAGTKPAEEEGGSKGASARSGVGSDVGVVAAPPPIEGAEEVWVGVRRHGVGGSEAPMTLLVRAILGGAGRVEEVEVRDEGAIDRAFSVESFDDEAKVWVRQHASSTRGTFVRLQGTKDGGRAIWCSAADDPKRALELELAWPEPGRWVRTQSVSEDGGRTWRVLWIDELWRVECP